MTIAARFAAAFLIVAFTALSIVRTTVPPRPMPATAPTTDFSADRALQHVEQIARAPHGMGTAEHDRVRDYIVAQLRLLGLEPRIQTTTAVGTRYRESGLVQNILVRLPGRDAGGKAVLIAVHYDGVEAGPAAADDGAGSAAVLETLRALRARQAPLAHDVIALFTDGEESGLIGAAAFVREDPWARDVAIALNFEARGTSGRSYMFETGPGNLDAVRVLRTADDAVTAGSVFSTIYRTLNNDTDLSELALLDIPALNFAFADGVERYHTSHDDLAHLNRGSLQHHGMQMLALAAAFADVALPRPRTGDAVFFDLPLIGLAVYPQWLAAPFAVLLLLFAGVVVRRPRRGVIAAAGVMLAAVAVSGLLASQVRLSGPAAWSGLFAAAVAIVTIGLNLAAYFAARKRWNDDVYAGAVLVWVVLSIAASFASPGVSYLFTWPALLAVIALRTRHIAAHSATAAFTLTLLAGFAYTVTAVMLGVFGPGAIALAALTALITWLVAPVLERAVRTTREAALIAGAGLVLAVVGFATVRPSADHPVRTGLVYAENADTAGAWLGVGNIRDDWTRSALPSATRGPAWTRMVAGGAGMIGRSVPRADLGRPTVTVLGDTTAAGSRVLVLRLTAPSGTTGLVIRARNAKVLRASIDGRLIDTTRFRQSSAEWRTEFWNVPERGTVVSLTLPAGSALTLDLTAWRPGLPAAVSVPPRPAQFVASQSGDISVVYARTVLVK